jgi:hypothetical protein
MKEKPVLNQQLRHMQEQRGKVGKAVKSVLGTSGRRFESCCPDQLSACFHSLAF